MTVCEQLDRKSLIHMHRELLRPGSSSLVTNLLRTAVLNAELYSIKSILTYVPFCSRWVSAVWRAVVMASSVDLFAVYAGPVQGGFDVI